MSHAFAALESGRVVTTSPEAMGVRLLPLPFRVEDAYVPAGAQQVTMRDRPDVIVLTEGNGHRLLAEKIAEAAIIPVVDATCASGPVNGADVTVPAVNRGALTQALDTLVPVVERFRALPADVRNSRDRRIQLLARLAVREKTMTPRRTASTRETAMFDDELAVPGAQHHADALVMLGLLRRHYFDTVITCGHCASARVCARELCLSCGSANLNEEPIIHHLRCSYQAPQREFRRPDGFVCPKCRQALEHFSVDYDRPGSLCMCNACGHASSETAASFLCLDCNMTSAPGQMATAILHHYALTPSGRAFVVRGGDLPDIDPSEDRLLNRIRIFAQANANTDCCILAIQIGKSDGGSGRAYQDVHAFLASELRELLVPEVEILTAPSALFALMPGERRRDVERALPEIRKTLERHLAAKLPLRYSVHEASAFEQAYGVTEF